MSSGKETALDRVRSDVIVAMKAGDKERASALRMLQDALQQEARFGKGDEVALLQRERKKRIEAAEAFEKGDRAESAASERFEAELIEGYLPSQLSDEELTEIVDAAVEEAGATEVSQMGPVIGRVVAMAEGRADGKRISQAVRERLGA